MGTVDWIVELENRFASVFVSEFGRDDWNTANKIVEGAIGASECLSCLWLILGPVFARSW